MIKEDISCTHVKKQESINFLYILLHYCSNSDKLKICKIIFQFQENCRSIKFNLEIISA